MSLSPQPLINLPSEIVDRNARHQVVARELEGLADIAGIRAVIEVAAAGAGVAAAGALVTVGASGAKLSRAFAQV